MLGTFIDSIITKEILARIGNKKANDDRVLGHG